MTAKPVRIILGKGASVDLMKMLDGRVLIVGSSGSGKSYLVRVMVEQIVEQIPTIILDREGEFATLREKYDVVLIGEGGEADASIATAAKLARTLVELGVSAVINLYDLSKADKKKFVRIFLEALLSLPRSSWRPIALILDEAHEFCSESGECESREAVVRVMDSGRKRGIMGMLCTQRYSKLSKDAAAEASNIFIGRITLDNDLRRASDTLGFSGKTEWGTLRSLADGEWFAFGPAIEQRGVIRFQGNHAKTTHPRPGQRHKLLPPAPSRAILKVAPELAALKQKVVEEKNELQRLREENATLKASARSQPKTIVQTTPAKVDNAAIAAARVEGYAQAVEGLQPLSGLVNDLQATLSKIEELASQGPNAIKAIVKTLASVSKASPRAPKSNGRTTASALTVHPRNVQLYGAPSRSQPGAVQAPARRGSGPGDARVNKGLRRILTVLAQHPEGVERTQLALLAQFAPTAGHFSNLISEARKHDWTSEADGRFYPTDAGNEALGEYQPLPEGQALIDYWVGWAKGSGKQVLQAAIDAGEDGISREDLAHAAGLAPTAGHYSNILSDFRTAKLIEGSKHIKASRFLIDARGQ